MLNIFVPILQLLENIYHLYHIFPKLTKCSRYLNQTILHKIPHIQHLTQLVLHNGNNSIYLCDKLKQF